MANSVEEVRRLDEGREGSSNGRTLRKPKAKAAPAPAQPSSADFRIVGHPLLILLVVALLSGFCGVVVNSRAFLVTVVVTSLMVLGLVLPTLNLLGLRGEIRYARRRGEVGKDFSVCLAFRRLWPWPTYGLLVRGGWTSRKKKRWRLVDEAVWSLPVLRGRRATETTVTFAPTRRGVYPKTQAWVTTSFPLGMRWARRRIESRGRTIIWPAIVPLERAVSFGASDGWSDAVDTRRPGTQGPWSGTRPYQPGEPLRKIHWRQTARHDQLIVCERSAPAGRGAQIVLETDPSVYQGPSAERMREKAFSAAASLAVAMVRMGVRISVVMDNKATYEATSPEELTPFLDALAGLEDDQGARLAGLLGRPECHGTEGLTQILVTTRRGLARLVSSEFQGASRRWVIVEPRGADSPAGDGGRAEGADCRRSAGMFFLPVSDPDDVEFHRLWKEMCREM